MEAGFSGVGSWGMAPIRVFGISTLVPIFKAYAKFKIRSECSWRIKNIVQEIIAWRVEKNRFLPRTGVLKLKLRIVSTVLDRSNAVQNTEKAKNSAVGCHANNLCNGVLIGRRKLVKPIR